ncbi:EpsG family protein [Aeromonas caviae]|uniref:EpsG family protein n=1 Tax=Aeromonas caviae TaxID=648 RepID=UPI0028695196|nr:EpsG family protein [Aeromonas caviae]WMX35614.1 EpsG family protein [Aeromonas caviae]
MTYEMMYYIFLCIVGFIFCFFRISSDRVYFTFVFLLFFIYSLVTRFSGFEIDFITYAKELEIDSYDIYYLKEPVYWLFSRVVYDFFASKELTFVFFDSIAFVLVIVASRKMNLPQFFPFLFLLFFPAVMGMNNVYRQYLAYAIYIFFFSLVISKESPFKSIFFLVLSILTHNVVALFSPLLLIFNGKKRLELKVFIIYTVIIMLLPFALATKSNSDTGTLGGEVYLIVFFLIILFYSFTCKFRFDDLSSRFLHFFIYMFSLALTSFIVMGGAQSKRVGMFMLMVSLVPLILVIEKKYKQKKIVRATIYTVLIMPTFFFSSSRDMLLTVVN